MVANFRAVAVLAAAGPRRAFIRRWNEPSQVSVRAKVGASVRNRIAARLTTRAVRLLSTLPPLILLPGHSPSHAQNALALGHRLMSTPISEIRISTLSRLNPT